MAGMGAEDQLVRVFPFELQFAGFNRCMNEAKTMRMSWVEGLKYTISTLNA
jgi:hypothetical protein